MMNKTQFACLTELRVTIFGAMRPDSRHCCLRCDGQTVVHKGIEMYFEAQGSCNFNQCDCARDISNEQFAEKNRRRQRGNERGTAEKRVLVSKGKNGDRLHGQKK
jgi:hypothetical protein